MNYINNKKNSNIKTGDTGVACCQWNICQKEPELKELATSSAHAATAIWGHDTSKTDSVAVVPGPAAPDAGFHVVAE